MSLVEEKTEITPFDREMMRRCLALARRAQGRTAPNPMVGAVIVQDGRIVGEGFHPQAGQPHAEVFALREAGELATGATIYVSLEPCSHFGRTPPCADALIRAGVARVVVGMVDPNPKVAGAGIARLQAAGIDVTVGVEEDECRALNEGFIHRILRRRPLGILKYAMTLDGKIASSTGHSAWITSPAARAWVHQLRSQCDAIVVGGNTVRHDDPLLTSHGAGHDPLRVVLTRSLDLPLQAKLWKTGEAKTLVVTECADATKACDLEKQGVEVVTLRALTPARVMEQLHERDCLSVLWECGGALAAKAIADHAVQKVFAFVAPKIIGGAAAPTPVGELGLTRMDQAISLERVRWHMVGPDLLLEGYVPENIELTPR